MLEKEKIDAKPMILAPAGNRVSFLAAIAAGADAIYCGLPQFSARMMAKNFSLGDLAVLTRFAHAKSVKVYITLNSQIKTDELDSVGKQIDLLNRYVIPDGVIIQDLGLIPVLESLGFSGEVHLSTLANVSFPSAVGYIESSFNVRRVVVPRELHIDEIKEMANACGKTLKIESFVHGALCYGVSGRCYWSSFLGGKSGLRGHCVQPCRRIYQHPSGKRRFFSCKDFSADVLVKVLSGIENLATLKIEGRKKSAFYVYYTVLAYKMLRDQGKDPGKKKDALFLLGESLGRPSSHYNLLPQRPQSPIDVNEHTGSGLFIGNVKGHFDKPYISPRRALLRGDVLRIGYEDESSHHRISVSRHVPKNGKLFLNKNMDKSSFKDISVFLVDRRDEELTGHLSLLEKELSTYESIDIPSSSYNISLPSYRRKKERSAIEMNVYRHHTDKKKAPITGIWVSEKNVQSQDQRDFSRIWWWLSPSIWPDNQPGIVRMIQILIEKGARTFVLNSPWQVSLFPSKEFELWAGPFCNVMNPSFIGVLKNMGFSGVVVSPELGKDDFSSIASCSSLRLGIVLSGMWPLCISRTVSADIQLEIPFESPKGEIAWVSRGDCNYWVFPNWELDISDQMNALKEMGYEIFFHLKESIPKEIQLKKRSGIFNWNCGLK